MAKLKKGPKDSTRVNRRAVLKGALAVGGAAMLGGAAVAKPVQTVVVTETEWARALARVIAAQLPAAISQMPDLQLTPDQVFELQQAYANTLVINMGCEFPPS